MLSLAVKRERYRFMAGVRRQVRERWGTRDVVPIRDDEDKRGRKEAERVFSIDGSMRLLNTVVQA